MSRTAEPSDLVILTNFVPPPRLPAFRYLSRRFRTAILADTVIERNRRWAIHGEDLDIRVVPAISIPVHYRHPQGFLEESYLHLPYGLGAELLKARPERIVSGELGFRTAVACLYKALRPRTPLVVWCEGTPHTDGPRGAFRRWWRRALVRWPDRFVAVSHGARELLRSYGVREDRISVSLFVSGFYPPPSIPERNSAQRRRILHCGALTSRKGVRQLAEGLIAAMRGEERPVEVWFAGDGPEETYLRGLALPAGLTFRFLGFVPYERMPEVYGECGILAFPTLADVWGLVTNEAMMYGIPVLGSLYAESVCDLVRDGQNGWTFRPDDPSGTESAIRRALAAGVDELERMGVEARSSVEGLSPEAFAKDLVAALERAARESAR